MTPPTTPDLSSLPSALASALPSEVIQSILSHSPTPIDQQQAQLACNLVSRHWYSATKNTTQYAVAHPKQATKLALKLVKQRKIAHVLNDSVSMRVRRLYLSLAKPGGIKSADAKAFAKLLDACPELDSLELSVGHGLELSNEKLKENKRILGPMFADGSTGLEEAMVNQKRLRVFKYNVQGKVLESRALIRLLYPLQNLQVLDLYNSELSEVPYPPGIPIASLELPLHTLILHELRGPHSFITITNLFQSAVANLRTLRLGYFWGESRDALTPLLEGVKPFAHQLLEFEMRICRYTHLPFDSKPYLDLNNLLQKMTSLDTLAITLSGCDSEDDEPVPHFEIDEVRSVDVAIISSLDQIKCLKHLVLYVQMDVPMEELVEFARASGLRSFTLIIMSVGSDGGGFDGDDEALWMKELPARIRDALPASTVFESRFEAI
ncbi:hypothetical protein P7C70_g6614, partial [Phenoliferia sp. Uapishka_3]